MMKWTMSNVVSMAPRNSEGTERNAPVCGVNSKDPRRIAFLELENVGADDIGDAGKNAADMIGAADEVPCASRVPTDGANR
jgi:hypothetical protein